MFDMKTKPSGDPGPPDAHIPPAPSLVLPDKRSPHLAGQPLGLALGWGPRPHQARGKWLVGFGSRVGTPSRGCGGAQVSEKLSLT